MPLGNAARPGLAHIINRGSIQGPTITSSLIIMCSIHGRDWSSQSYGLKLNNSGHCSRTSQSLGAMNVVAALLVTSYWRSNFRLCIHATMVGQSHFVRELQRAKELGPALEASRQRRVNLWQQQAGQKHLERGHSSCNCVMKIA